MATRLQEAYVKSVKQQLMEQFNYKNPMQVPRLEKIVINMGVGETTSDIKKMDAAIADLTAITGQKPQMVRSKKAIANFKLRRGLPIGAKVTLRGARMYEFLDRLVTIALPRVRDFRGLSGKSFDGHGNYVLGLKVEDFLERRLQTIVWKLGLAKSIHHARVLIRQRHIRVGRQVVNVPSFMVRAKSEGTIDFSPKSAYNQQTGRPGRVKRKHTKSSGGDAGGEDDE